MSLSCVFSIDFFRDEFNIIVEAEDAGDKQEGLGNIDQQTVRHVVNHNDLIRHQRNAAHDEQHRTGVLRDFKACVFHSIRSTLNYTTKIQKISETCKFIGCFLHKKQDIFLFLDNGNRGRIVGSRRGLLWRF